MPHHWISFLYVLHGDLGMESNSHRYSRLVRRAVCGFPRGSYSSRDFCAGPLYPWAFWFLVSLSLFFFLIICL